MEQDRTCPLPGGVEPRDEEDLLEEDDDSEPIEFMKSAKSVLYCPSKCSIFNNNFIIYYLSIKSWFVYLSLFYSFVSNRTINPGSVWFTAWVLRIQPEEGVQQVQAVAHQEYAWPVSAAKG